MFNAGGGSLNEDALQFVGSNCLNDGNGGNTFNQCICEYGNVYTFYLLFQ